MSWNRRVALAIWLFVPLQSDARTLRVPEEFFTIQLAIDSAAIRDTVLLSPGEHVEAVQVPAMGLTVGSDYLLSGDTTDVQACTWRGKAFLGDSVRCITSTDSTGTVPEVTVIGIRFAQSATHYADSGGAILLRGFQGSISHCIFDTCSAGFGGAIAAVAASVTLRQSRFHVCGQYRTAAVIGIIDSDALLDSCTVVNSVSYEAIDQRPSQYRLERGSLHIRHTAHANLGFGHYPAGTNIVGVRDSTNRVEIVGCEFHSNRISPLVAYSEQVDYLRIDSNYFSDNGLAGNLFSQDAFDSATTLQVIGNVFERFTPVPGYMLSGPFSLDTSQQNTTIIERNLVQDMDSGNVAFCGVYYNHPHRSIRYNYILNNSNWSWTWPPSGMVLTVGIGEGELEHNIFMGNQGYAIFQGLINVTSYARHNYFGHETGPFDSVGNPGGQGDTIDFRVIYQPWEVDTSFMSSVTPQLPIEPVVNSFIGNVYPNPFNSETTIEFVILKEGDTDLRVYDILGREIGTVLHQTMRKGVHVRTWRPENSASGIYIAHLQAAEGATSSYKMLYVK